MNTDAIMTLLTELSGKMAEPATHVWQIYLKQTITFGALDLGFGTLFLVLAVWFTMKLLAKDEDGDYVILDPTYDDAEIDRFFIWAGILCLLIMGTLLIIRGTMYISNPEYWVIKDLAKSFITGY